jgi:tripartite ATP-independent transporter DctM subunit
MDASSIGILGIAGFLILIALRCPIAISMAIVGLFGSTVLNGWSATIYVFGSVPFESIFPYSLSVVPLFVIMGSLALRTGMSQSLYNAGEALFGHWRGGLSIGTIVACAGFGAICGSSLATAATMSRISIPEMQRRGYADGFSAATVAAGGTLGVLIPPSIILVIYGILTEQSIGRLFVASLIPGLLATLLYGIAVFVTARMKQELCPATAVAPTSHRLKQLSGAWPVLALFVVVLGGMFTGQFSPTEAASVGVIGVLTIALFRRTLSLQTLIESIKESASLTGLIFMILIGAALFNYFIEATQITHILVSWISDSGFSTWQVVLVILLMYIVLGCFVDSISMIFLTIPFIYPIILAHQLDPIWFGILLLSVVEIGLITPPVGMNLFVVKAAVPSLSMATLYRSILPFLAADFVRLALIAMIPALSLGLVSVFYGGN